MATYSAYQGVHKTLGGNGFIDTVNLTKSGALALRVVNRSTVEPLTFVIGRGVVPDPVALGDNLDVVPPGAVQDVDLEHYDRGDGTLALRGYRGGAGDPIIVKVIGNSGAYSVLLLR